MVCLAQVEDGSLVHVFYAVKHTETKTGEGGGERGEKENRRVSVNEGKTVNGRERG